MTAYDDAKDAANTLFSRSIPPQIRPEEVNTVVQGLTDAIKDELDGVVVGQVNWGLISGSLPAQTDLQAALDAKAPLTRALPAGGTTGQALTKTSGADYDVQWSSAAGGVSDGDKGDITVSASGATWTIDSNVISTFGRTLTDDADAATARTTLGLVIGTDVQAFDADLASWASVTRASGFDTFAATPSSANLRSLLTDETGTGAAVFATSPTLVTPALGTPSSGTLTNCTGLPLASVVDSTTEALGVGTLEVGHASDTTLSRSAAGVLAVEGVDLLKANGNQTVTGGFAVTPFNDGTVSSGTNTPVASDGNYQFYTNNGAHTLAAPTSDCAIDILVTNGASAGSITFSGFTVGSSTGSLLTTTNTHRFIISIRRINSISTYSIYALQ